MHIWSAVWERPVEERNTKYRGEIWTIRDNGHNVNYFKFTKNFFRKNQPILILIIGNLRIVPEFCDFIQEFILVEYVGTWLLLTVYDIIWSNALTKYN